MDKENLYYIVRKGTNNRMLCIDKSVLIIDQDIFPTNFECRGAGYDQISIAEYEKKYCESDK